MANATGTALPRREKNGDTVMAGGRGGENPRPGTNGEPQPSRIVFGKTA
jgi:hypothetical protein